MQLRVWAAAILAISAPLGAAHAQDMGAPLPRPAVPETLTELDADGVLETMNGAQLRGCYIDGRERFGDDPEWGEHTAEDGALYDLLQDGKRVGRWYTVNQYICYVYEWYQRGQASCFSVGVSEDEHLYFTVVETGATIATTDCRAPAVS